MASERADRVCGEQAAIEQIRSLRMASRPALIAVFRPNCMDLVLERFGAKGVTDCLDSIAASIAGALQPQDLLYTVGSDGLLAVCERPLRVEQLRAEWSRVLARNRDFTIVLGERKIMLRIPIALSILTLEEFCVPDPGAPDSLSRILDQVLTKNSSPPDCPGGAELGGKAFVPGGLC